ncbi:peptidase M3A/M3B [Calycina marina]|uniref:Peptidase M3A/M3B n=1 Tax=Calycina marina TaxID=1763456 RepID=A0A9P7ZAQ1_9HELO|nr:peptidase M3A/M3B [Calycina marina]
MIAYINVVAQNASVFRGMVLLRDEVARLLGYRNPAAFRLEGKVAKTSEIVNSFLGVLRAMLASGGEKELDVLRKIEQNDLQARGEADGGNLYPAIHFITGQDYLKRMQGMLSFFQHLFGLKIAEVASDEQNGVVWRRDLHLFGVWGRKKQWNAFLGCFSSSFSKKLRHDQSFIREDGNHQHTVSALVRGFFKPSLLKHSENMMLFQELSYGIHDLLSKTKNWNFCGGSTAPDFSEAPSQMLENWFCLP